MPLRDCPQCGTTFAAVNPYCICTNCHHRFTALPTQILLAGKLGKTSHEQLLSRIADFHGVPYLESLDYPVVSETAKQIGESVARMNGTIPLDVDGTELFVITDPEAPEALEMIIDILDRFPDFAVADEQQIRAKLNQHYGCMTSETSMDFTPGPEIY